MGQGTGWVTHVPKTSKMVHSAASLGAQPLEVRACSLGMLKKLLLRWLKRIEALG